MGIGAFKTLLAGKLHPERYHDFEVKSIISPTLLHCLGVLLVSGEVDLTPGVMLFILHPPTWENLHG